MEGRMDYKGAQGVFYNGLQACLLFASKGNIIFIIIASEKICLFSWGRHTSSIYLAIKTSLKKVQNKRAMPYSQDVKKHERLMGNFLSTLYCQNILYHLLCWTFPVLPGRIHCFLFCAPQNFLYVLIISHLICVKVVYICFSCYLVNFFRAGILAYSSFIFLPLFTFHHQEAYLKLLVLNICWVIYN